MDETSPCTAGTVLLFVPNLIGYFRVFSTLTALVLMILFPDGDYWVLAISLYIASFVGDLFDGMAARKFNQCSVFGGLLDMITDRCSTLGLLYVLGMLQSDTQNLSQLIFLFLILLDISSHWCQMFASSGEHHKSAEANAKRNPLVLWYYQYYWFFGYLCVGAEFTYIICYCLHYLKEDDFLFMPIRLFFYMCLPGCVLKQIINVVQLSSSCYAVAEEDASKRVRDANQSNKDKKLT